LERKIRWICFYRKILLISEKNSEIKNSIINTLSVNNYTISQTKYLFNNIIEQFERNTSVSKVTVK